MKDKSNTQAAAALVLGWLALTASAAILYLRDSLFSGSARTYQVQYTDVEGRIHRVQADDLRDLEDMLRAMEARFPR